VNPILERQRWLAAFALAVSVPLPLTGVVSVPFLVPYLAVALWTLTATKPLSPFPVWLENLLAPAILAAVVAAGGVRFGLLRPVAQLAVLVAAVRLPGCGQRGRAKLTGGMISLVGVAGVASSTHPTLAPYLIGLLVLVLVAVGRLTGVELSEGGTSRGRTVAWPPLRLVVGTAVMAVLVAAPIFALLPRLRSPFAAAPFGGRAVSGFREAVALHGIGDVKLSRRLVLRVSFPGVEPGHVSPDWLRLVGATMKHYRAGSWVEGRLKAERLTSREGRPAVLATVVSPAAMKRAEFVLEREGGNLFSQVGAATIEMRGPVAVSREPSGSLRFPRGTDLPISYAVDFDPTRVEQPPPDDADLELPPAADRLRELAQRATGGTTNRLAAALAIEQYLQQNFQYALRSNAPVREDPVEWFLFRSREGHCEFFASSMVLLLRTIGIPARLQAGYAGGEPDGEGGYNVRDSHAHAWVVAYVQNQWRVFDPTPPEGRPGILDAGEAQSLRAAWDRLETGWDRWVLTFSLSDQVSMLQGAAEAAARSLPVLARAIPAAVLLVALVLLLRLRRNRQPGPIEIAKGAPRITRALQRVVAGAARRGAPVVPGTTAREFARLASAMFPAAAEPLAWLVGEHERCRYAGAPSPARSRLRPAIRAVERAMNAH
jgi:transglutaminase-like putative cysteine protease